MTLDQLRDALARQADDLPQDPETVKLLLGVLHQIAGNFQDGMPLRGGDQCQFCWLERSSRKEPHAPDCVAPILDHLRCL